MMRLFRKRRLTCRGVALMADDRMRRQVIERLMCQLDIELDGVAAGFGIVEAFAAELGRLQPMASDGLVEITGRRVRITERGRPFMRTVAAVFDGETLELVRAFETSAEFRSQSDAERDGRDMDAAAIKHLHRRREALAGLAANDR